MRCTIMHAFLFNIWQWGSVSVYGKNVNTGCNQMFTSCLLCLESTAGGEYRTNCMQAQYKVIPSPHISQSNNLSYTFSF